MHAMGASTRYRESTVFEIAEHNDKATLSFVLLQRAANHNAHDKFSPTPLW